MGIFGIDDVLVLDFFFFFFFLLVEFKSVNHFCWQVQETVKFSLLRVFILFSIGLFFYSAVTCSFFEL